MASKKYLSKAEILGQNDLKYEDVQVPEWGDAWVRVRSMSASERDHFEAGTVRGNGRSATTNLEHIRARLCIACVVDETGERVFAEEDTFPLGAKSAAALDRIFTVARRLNKMTEEDINELAANFPQSPNADSPTA